MVGISQDYLQKVNTEILVLDLRKAVNRALSDGMPFATAVGTLRLMMREIEDDAITQLKEEANVANPE